MQGKTPLVNTNIMHISEIIKCTLKAIKDNTVQIQDTEIAAKLNGI